MKLEKQYCISIHRSPDDAPCAVIPPDSRNNSSWNVESMAGTLGSIDLYILWSRMALVDDTVPAAEVVKKNSLDEE